MIISNDDRKKICGGIEMLRITAEQLKGYFTTYFEYGTISKMRINNKMDTMKLLYFELKNDLDEILKINE